MGEALNDIVAGISATATTTSSSLELLCLYVLSPG